MDAPKCKLCGSRHYGLCVASTAIDPAPTPAPKPVPVPVPVPVPEDDRAKAERERQRRNDYQREYMRKRRNQSPEQFAIYAFVREQEPSIVKIGMSRRWLGRKEQHGKALSYSVYFISSDIGLTKLIFIETLCSTSMGILPCRGREWFETSIEHARAVIEKILNSNNVPFTFEHGPNPNKEKPIRTRPKFDRNAYQREYMRKRRARLKPVQANETTGTS